MSSVSTKDRSRGGLKYKNAAIIFQTGIEWTTEEVYLTVEVSLSAIFSGGIILLLKGKTPVASQACRMSWGVNAELLTLSIGSEQA